MSIPGSTLLSALLSAISMPLPESFAFLSSALLSTSGISVSIFGLSGFLSSAFLSASALSIPVPRSFALVSILSISDKFIPVPGSLALSSISSVAVPMSGLSTLPSVFDVSITVFQS